MSNGLNRIWYSLKPVLIAALIITLLSITGCVGMFTAKTVATYEMPDGKKISYESNKEQIGLDAVYELYENGQVKAVKIKVDKATTPEAAIAAALQVQSEIIKQVIPLLLKGATSGAAGMADPEHFATRP